MRPHPAGPRHGDLLHDGPPAAPPADLNTLVSHVWPRGAERSADGTLAIRGASSVSLVARHGTPLFVILVAAIAIGWGLGALATQVVSWRRRHRHVRRDDARAE